MGYALPISIQMTDMECGSCGVCFSMPETLRAERERDGGSWYCPNGHSRMYRETDVQRLTKKLEEAARTNTRLAEQVREAQMVEQKAVAEQRRLKRRVQAGVCPCCNRTFQNLARHMTTKHKDELR